MPLKLRIVYRKKNNSVDYSKYTRAICRGDRDVFRLYMDTTMDSVYKLACRIIASEDDAKDIVQETYIKVWEKRKTLKSDKSIFSWTRKIAINKCYDYLRSEKRKGRWNGGGDISELERLVSDSSAEEKVNNEEYSKILKMLTSRLSVKQQMVYTLSVIEKQTADEIALLTGLSKSSIKSNLYHAREAIKKNAERIL